LSIFPFHQNLDYDYPISKSIFELPTLFSFLFLAGLLCWAKWLFSKYRLVSFSIFWFFLTLLPESSFLPIHDVIFEHRLYLPLAGYSIFLVSGAYYGIGLLFRRGFRMTIGILTIIVIFNSVLTYQRNKVWKDEFTLWGETIQRAPHKARPYINRGLAYYKQGNFIQAVFDHSKALVLKPESVKGEYYNRGLAYYGQDNFTNAISDYTQAIKLDPKYEDAYYNRGNAYFKQGNFVQAIADYNKAIVLNPRDEDGYNNRGLAYFKQGNFSQALADYDKAITLNPQNADARHNLALLYKKLKQKPGTDK
jgi:tetratricopeptide (TPR) repeat protein